MPTPFFNIHTMSSFKIFTVNVNMALNNYRPNGHKFQLLLGRNGVRVCMGWMDKKVAHDTFHK